MASNWMELRLTQDEEEFVKRNAETYRAVHVETIDTIFGWAKSIEILQKRFYSSGVQGAFADALVQYGFTSRDGGPMAKSIRSNLKNLLDNEQAVRKWWASVPQKTKRDWISARAIHNHWKASLRPADAPRKLSAYAEMKATNIELQEQLTQRRAENRELRTADDGGNLFTENSSAEHVIKSVGNLFRTSPAKLRAIATGLNKFAKDIEDLTKTARPKRGKR